MAKSFSDIMSNYKDMSVAELGTSLLERKEEREKEARRAAKKSAKVEKALALLLAGQTIFKGAFNKRAKELESAYQFQLADNESQTKEINMLSKLTQPMYQWSKTVKDKTFANEQEKLDSFIGSDYFDSFMTSVGNYIEPAFKQSMGDKYEAFINSTPSSNVRVEAAKEYAKHYLKDDQYLTATKKLAELFNMPEKDFDEIELFKRGMGLKTHEMNEIERRNYRLILDNLRGEANVFSGLKQVFQKFGKKEEETGGLSLFQALDDEVLLGPSVNRILDNLDFQGLTNTIVNEQIVALNRSSKRSKVEAQSPKYKRLKESMEAFMEDLENKIGGTFSKNKFEMYSSLSRRGQANIISRSDLDDLFDNMSPLDRDALERDGFELSILLDPAFSENDKFIKGLYTSNHKGGDLSFEQFKNRLKDDTFRIQYGITLAASEGFKDIGSSMIDWAGESRYQPNGDVVETQYNRFSGNVPVYLNEGIVKPTEAEPNYALGDSWDKMSKDQKLLDFNSTLLDIQRTGVDEKSKQIEIDNLFANVPNPLGLSYADYIKSDEYLKYVNFILMNTGISTIKRVPML